MALHEINGSPIAQTFPMNDIGIEAAQCENGRWYDICPAEPVEITADSLDELKSDVMNWLEVESWDDVSQGRQDDWDWLVRQVSYFLRYGRLD